MSRQQRSEFMAVAALAALMCLPAVAQTASVSGAQAASQPAAQSSNGETATHKPPLAAPVRQGFWGRINPFARKKYVQGQLQPIRNRVNELDGLTSANTKSISDLSASDKAGIAAARARAQQAADAADTAQQQAQEDSNRAAQLNEQVSAASTRLQGVDQYQVAQTAELQFRPGPAELSTGAQQQLSSFLQGLGSQSGYVVEVTAYAPRPGAAGITASQELADAVVRDMVLNENVPLYRIYTASMGNARPAASPGGMASAQMTTSERRRTGGGTVVIRILKSSLASASNGSGPANPNQ